MQGAYAIPANAPDPVKVTPDSGRVAFRLFVAGSNPGPAAGLLIVQMTDGETLRAQVFPGSQAVDAPFTDAAQTYRR